MSSTNDDDGTPWFGVRERVLALRELDGSRKVFGVHGHGFALEPVLSPEELAALEAAIGTRLPPEYRGFLLTVGAGGAGPAYGVFPVGRGPDGRWGWRGDGGGLTDVARLAEPFPVAGPDPAALAALLAEQPEEDDADEPGDPDAFDALYEAWDERMTNTLWNPDRTVGAVCLCHLGCARREWLIVNGPERGRVWSDDRADDVDLAPLRDPHGRPLTFARWYLDWLERAERDCARPSRPAHSGA